MANSQTPLNPDEPTERRIAIDVSGVEKTFKLGSEPASTLKERLLTSRRSRLDSFEALKGVDFQVMEGETVGILGRNGSGKSTLLKIIAGTIRPTSGTTRVRGRLSALLELGAGFHPDLTGRENIYLNGSILGLSKVEVEKIFDEILDFAELGEFIDLQVRYYSSGMVARLGFAVATHLEPDILLVDEVLSVGDEAFQKKCIDRVYRFKKLGKTMLLVSHGPERVRQLCDRAVVLHRGECLYVGDVNEAIDLYRDALKTDHKNNLRAAGQKLDESTVRVMGGEILGLGPDNAIKPGDPLSLQIRYEMSEPVEFRLRLQIKSGANVILMNQTTDHIFGKPLSGGPGKGQLQFLLERIPLAHGDYYFTIIAESPDGKKVIDHIPKLDEFKVEGGGLGRGFVDIPVSCPPNPVTDLTNVIEQTMVEAPKPVTAQ